MMTLREGLDAEPRHASRPYEFVFHVRLLVTAHSGLDVQTGRRAFKGARGLK